MLEHLERYVVKAVGESGGYGMLIGPHSHRGRARGIPPQRVEADPRNYIAQPTILLSRAPCLIDGTVQPRHVDLRPYILFGERDHHRAGWADAGGAAERLAGGEFVARRRQQGYLGAALTCFPASPTVCIG